MSDATARMFAFMDEHAERPEAEKWCSVCWCGRTDDDDTLCRACRGRLRSERARTWEGSIVDADARADLDRYGPEQLETD